MHTNSYTDNNRWPTTNLVAFFTKNCSIDIGSSHLEKLNEKALSYIYNDLNTVYEDLTSSNTGTLYDLYAL